MGVSGVDLVLSLAGDVHPQVTGDTDHGEAITLVVQPHEHDGVGTLALHRTDVEVALVLAVGPLPAVGADHEEGQAAGLVLGTTLLGEPTEDVETAQRSEEHTSELQSRFDLVCRLLLEKKKK